MRLSSLCMNCLVQRQQENISDIKDENLKSDYMREVLKIIADSSDKDTAPVVISKINKLHQSYFGTSYSFNKLKEQYNHFMLQEEPYIHEKINASDDRLLSALKFSRIGNYIDFGAMGTIDDEKLKSLLASADKDILDPTEYLALKRDLVSAKHLVYLTDNCGEIVLDKILIKIIKEQYPDLKVTVIVRGKPVLNDATLEDAKMVGLTGITDVIGNGTEIAGTQLDMISSEASRMIDSADLIISKGQGNFETLHNCGLNIYYMFLCKCDWFVNRFQLEKFKGVFVNDRNILKEMKN